MNTAQNKRTPDIIEMITKKRHIHLLQKMQQGKVLTRAETRELAKYESGQLPPGVVETQDEVAAACGVDVRSVQRWLRKGAPRREDGRYNLVDIMQWKVSRDNNTHNSEEEPSIQQEPFFWQLKFAVSANDATFLRAMIIAFMTEASLDVRYKDLLKKIVILAKKYKKELWRNYGIALKQLENFLKEYGYVNSSCETGTSEDSGEDDRPGLSKEMIEVIKFINDLEDIQLLAISKKAPQGGANNEKEPVLSSS